MGHPSPGAERSAPENRSVFSVTLLLLTIVYTFNFIDRYILIVMQEAIKVDLDLSDFQLGLLTGLAFALFYTTLGIPIARYADRANRRNIIAVSLTIWSGMTALSGMAGNYWQLALARIGVGVGEAGASPPAHSMISDMYDENRRATALSIYSAGLYLGVAVGFAVGGYLLQSFGWRMTFVMVGLPGIVLAIIVRLFAKEPARQLTAQQQLEKPSFRDTVRHLWSLQSFRWVALACGMSAFVSYGVGSFNGSYMVRYHGLSPADTGLVLSVSNGFAGIVGTFLGGWLADRIGQRDRRWYVWLPGAAAIMAIPLLLVSYNTESVTVMLPLLFIGVALSAFYLAPAIAISHRLVSPNMRAMTSAILFLVLNLIGLGAGPAVVGLLADTLREIRGTESLRLAITLALSFMLVKGYFFYMAGRKLPADLDHVAVKASPE